MWWLSCDVAGRMHAALTLTHGALLEHSASVKSCRSNRSSSSRIQPIRSSR